MNLQGSYTFPAPLERVFAGLTDPKILQQVIPGCEKLEQTSPDEYQAHLKLGLASIKGTYTGKVRLADQEPPHRFTLRLEGKGGPGFVISKSLIQLKAIPQGTELTYQADVQVGGLIAAVGSRVVEAAGKKLLNDFFQKFAETIKPHSL